MTIHYKPYPEAVAIRSGCKVGWRYYATEAEAKICAVIAKHNAIRDRELGYDHGYCSPGTITAPDKQNFRPDLWEVCTC